MRKVKSLFRIRNYSTKKILSCDKFPYSHCENKIPKMSSLKLENPKNFKARNSMIKSNLILDIPIL